MVNEHPLEAPPGVSGKRVTIWVLISLAVIGVGISYTLWTYNRLDLAREQTAASWRVLTDQLARRYRATEAVVKQAAERGEVSEAFDARLRLAMDKFFTTSLPKEQNAAALHVEHLLQSEEIQSNVESPLSVSVELRRAADRFNNDLEQQRSLLSSPGGQILDLFLNLEEPSRFELASNTSL